MKNEIIRMFALAAFVITILLLPIDLLLRYTGNPVERIKQNFQIIMFTASMGNY